MNTRDLIEAVREPTRGQAFAGALVNPRLLDIVDASDYDALRAATLAVLDECIEAMTSAATWRQVFDARANARALREKLK